MSAAMMPAILVNEARNERKRSEVPMDPIPRTVAVEQPGEITDEEFITCELNADHIIRSYRLLFVLHDRDKPLPTAIYMEIAK